MMPKLLRAPSFLSACICCVAAGCSATRGGGEVTGSGTETTSRSSSRIDSVGSAPQTVTSDLHEIASLSDATFYRSLGIDIANEMSLQRGHMFAGVAAPSSVDAGGVTDGGASSLALSNYETQLPHTTQPVLPPLEQVLLTAYLDNPADAQLARFLALYHLNLSWLNNQSPGDDGQRLQHTIVALYFLSRARDLGATATWLTPTLASTTASLYGRINTSAAITLDENHPAHVYYRTTFHLNQEQNRYSALAQLLTDFAGEPRNVYTSFALEAVNLWMGGEADYADPTTLYDFVVGSYVSLHTIGMAQELEAAYDVDPTQPRFRLSAIQGGFSLLQRRWLATVHGDQTAIGLIDAEHLLWDHIQPAFHAFTYGLPYFDGETNFDQGLAAYAAGIPFCEEVPVRTCSDLPRFPFNLLGFTLGYADFLMKAGQLDAAEDYLSFRLQPSQTETYGQWTIGQPALTHRLNNLDAIYALYQDGDPSNDPINFEMKHRKWGSNTTTCQECHQTQGNPQTEADINAPQQFPPPQIASIVNWPPVTTAWYGAVFHP